MEEVLILISHGKMASEVLKSAEMITGDIDNVYTVHLLPEEGIDDFNRKLENVISKINKEDSITVIADLLGGTPCNSAIMQLKDRPSTNIISGYNLGMILEYIMLRESGISNIKGQVLNSGKNGIQDILDFVDNGTKEF
jgi:PTS system mannose-specific IIA component